jgi:N6-L-threonylcarbamoyladenine synthase
MVYIISKSGKPLMPTKNHAKVRMLLKHKKARIIRRIPFVIQLNYDTTEYTQEVTLGVDAGSKTIGLSATTKSDVLFESNVQLRNDITKLISVRAELRRSRRNRKTRYRKARFNNRRRNEDWLAPSIRQKIDTHLSVIARVYKILPIKRIVVEVASFDIQKIRNPDISGKEYQQGEQLEFLNVREYVLHRDGHICQCCKGKSKDKILNVHHIESRQTGEDAPNNLITLCETCHKGYHLGIVKLPKTIKRGMSFRDATFMGIMRWAFYNKLKGIYDNVDLTYGYITKNIRIQNNLSKDHYIDARCISDNPLAQENDCLYTIRKVRCHNRQLHKCKILKGGVRRNNQSPYKVFGLRLFDTVQYKRNNYIIVARRQTGFFDIRTFYGKTANKGSVSYKKLKLVQTNCGYITEFKKYTD